MHREDCPADPAEIAEDFVLNRMDPSEASIYQEHLAHCETCTECADKTREFVQAIRNASREFVDEDKELRAFGGCTSGI